MGFTYFLKIILHFFLDYQVQSRMLLIPGTGNGERGTGNRERESGN